MKYWLFNRDPLFMVYQDPLHNLKQPVLFIHCSSTLNPHLKIKVIIHGKTLLTPNRNPTYNRHYFVDILVLTIG